MFQTLERRKKYIRVILSDKHTLCLVSREHYQCCLRLCLSQVRYLDVFNKTLFQREHC